MLPIAQSPRHLFSEHGGSQSSNTKSTIYYATQRLAMGSEILHGSNIANATKALSSKTYSIDDLSVSYHSTETTEKHGQSYQFKKALLKNPLEVYSTLKKRLLDGSHRASFPEFEGVVQYLKNHLQHPFVLDVIKGNPFMENAHRLCMLELSHISFEFEVKPDPSIEYPHTPPVNGLYPFHSTITCIRTVLDFFDNLERATKNNIPPLYHSDRYTYHDQNLQFNPEFVAIPSECVFTLRDFVRLRSVPIAIMGVTAKTSFADSYYNSPRDFWVHDANHSRRLHSANQQFFKRNNITTEEGRFKVYQEWDAFIQNKIMPATQILNSLNQGEKDTRKMVKVVFFELYHEQALTPAKEDALKALNFKPGAGSAFEMILKPENKNEHYENRRLFNFNIDSGSLKYQADMNPRTVRYFHQSAPNVVTNLYDKLTREFYDNRYNAINDLPSREHRTPELVADALIRVINLYDIESRELGFETTSDVHQHFVNLARNHDSHGNRIGQSEIYHQQILNKPSLKTEIVQHVLNNQAL